MEYLNLSLIVALLGGIVDLDSTAAVQCMISQPIVAAPLTGLIVGSMLGDLTAGLELGLMIGIILQLTWIEQLPLGMNVPPDAALASVLSVALGFCAGQEFDYSRKEACYTIGLLVSVALGLLGRSLDMFVRRLNTNIDSWVNLKIEDNNFNSIGFGHLSGGFITFIKAFIFCFLIIWFGIDPLKYFIRFMSDFHSRGFFVLQNLLPAVGFSVLASMCIKNKTEMIVFISAIIGFTLINALLNNGTHINITIVLLISLAVMIATVFIASKQKSKRGKK